MALVNPKEIQIYELDDPQKCLQNISKSQAYFSVPADELAKFSNDGKHLLVSGSSGLVVYEMSTKSVDYELTQERILDIQMTNRQLTIAVHHAVKKQVSVYNPNKKDSKKKMVYLSNEQPKVSLAGDLCYLWTEKESYLGTLKLPYLLEYASSSGTIKKGDT